MQAELDIITPLKQLQQDASRQLSPLAGQRPLTGQFAEFTRGYLLAISHALEWAEIQQRRIERQEAK